MPDSVSPLTPDITPYQVDLRSQARARQNFMRLAVIAAIVFVVLLLLALKLQAQQNLLQEQGDINAANTVRMCEQRKANTIRTNAIWANLAKIESHNRFIDDKLRKERLDVYRTAILAVPECA